MDSCGYTLAKLAQVPRQQQTNISTEPHDLTYPPSQAGFAGFDASFASYGATPMLLALPELTS